MRQRRRRLPAALCSQWLDDALSIPEFRVIRNGRYCCRVSTDEGDVLLYIERLWIYMNGDERTSRNLYTDAK
jgi:hypothetical protein